MEDLSPTLNLVMTVRESLERGEPVRSGISEFLDRDSSDLRVFLLQMGQNNSLPEGRRPLKESERTVLSVLARGLAGESILPVLRELEVELVDRSEAEIDQFTQQLTLRSLIPLLLLIFPGYLLLLLGPTVERLLISLE